MLRLPARVPGLLLMALLVTSLLGTAHAEPGRWYATPAEVQAGLDFSGERLRAAWPALHAGDQEPYPDAARVRARLAENPALAASLPAARRQDYAGLAAELQDAWRAYHRGDYQQAWRLAEPLGLLGLYPASRARAIHTTYLVPEAERTDRYRSQMRDIEQALGEADPDDPNILFEQAYVMGRYSQGISIPTALAQGMAGRIRDTLRETLELAPRHPEALATFGAYHAEIVSQVGGFLARVTYGARAEEAVESYQQAIEIAPQLIIAYVEYADSLLKLDRQANIPQALRLLRTATTLPAEDATERLDRQRAQRMLADLQAR